MGSLDKCGFLSKRGLGVEPRLGVTEAGSLGIWNLRGQDPRAQDPLEGCLIGFGDICDTKGQGLSRLGYLNTWAWR